MPAITKNKDMIPQPFAACHGGEGTLMCRSLLDGCESGWFSFMHSDDMPAGVSIGVHPHEFNDEIYYLISGKGILTYDGVEYEMKAGDISVCTMGHSHAFMAVDDCRLIVVGSRRADR